MTRSVQRSMQASVPTAKRPSVRARWPLSAGRPAQWVARPTRKARVRPTAAALLAGAWPPAPAGGRWGLGLQPARPSRGQGPGERQAPATRAGRAGRACAATRHPAWLAAGAPPRAEALVQRRAARARPRQARLAIAVAPGGYRPWAAGAAAGPGSQQVLKAQRPWRARQKAPAGLARRPVRAAGHQPTPDPTRDRARGWPRVPTRQSVGWASRARQG